MDKQNETNEKERIKLRIKELKKMNRKELNQLTSLKYGFNSYPESTTYLGQYRYSPYPKSEVIKDIIKEEIKRGILK